MIDLGTDNNKMSKKITNLFKSADEEKRHILYEYEIYDILQNLGSFAPPASMVFEKNREYSDEELISLPGDRVVLKIISPSITHKTEVDGVRIIEKSASEIRNTITRMLAEVPEKYCSMVKNGSFHDKVYEGLSGEKLLNAVNEDINGVLLVQHISSASKDFGAELLVGIRNTREFGPIISAGIGGMDSELFAETFQKGQAFVTATTIMTTAEEFLEIFKNTVSYKKLSGHTRGRKPVSIDRQLLTCFSSFISLANFYSQANPEAPYIIEEFEVNPFVLHDSNPVPLDGLCRFSRPCAVPEKRPWHKIDKLLHPESIGIIGVSTTRVNYGRIILENILAEGFNRENIRIIRPGMDSFEGVTCVPDLESLDITLDLLVVAVGADQVPPVVDLVTKRKICESVMLIPGGMGETGDSKEMSDIINARISKAHSCEGGGPVFIGANSLGVVSHPGKYDTLFIPEEKLPKQRGEHKRNIAFLSQSGAFMITRISKLPELDPAYMISIGNQNDLTLGDMMLYFRDRDDIDVIAVYAEGFKDMDGLSFIKALKEAVNNGKDVIVYRAGKTPEGRSATGSHTVSIAGDYKAFEACVRQAGGIVASSFTQFSDLLILAKQLNKKTIRGNRIGALSGAGFEAVGMADNIDADEYCLKMAQLSDSTIKRLDSLLNEKGLSLLTEAKNPMDLNPGGDDEAHILAVRYMAEDDNVDAVVVGLDPLSPSTRTLFKPENENYDYKKPKSMVMELPELADTLDKPVIGVVDAGKLFDQMADELKSRNMVIFRSVDRALNALALYTDARLSRNKTS